MAKTTAAEGEQAEQAQSNLPLFYREPRPLDAQAHKDFALKDIGNLKFTSEVNAVPVNLVEMPQICHHYPIAFSPDANATPVAILGLRDKENLFLDDDGQWLAGAYVPAYIRRYPFIFSELPNTDQLTLCVDFVEGETVEENGERRFFDADGNASDISKNALEFCKSYHGAAQRTVEFSKALLDAGLLIDRQAQLSVGEDVRINFTGFKIIDESKLAELGDSVFIEWRKQGWLPYLYAHLFSGAQWRNLTNILAEKLEAEK